MKVLLCEDQESLLQAMVEMFRFNKYEVDSAQNGKIALELLESKQYDAIVMDVMMPYIDGITVVKKLRENNNETPVIMLTAKSDIDDKVLGLDIGANDYLSKPFDFKELFARIRVITRNKEVKKLQVGDIILDKNTFEIKSDIGCFCLANKEFKLLELLSTSVDKISSKKLLEKIWTDEDEIDESVVEMYVIYLQKKIKQISTKVKIKGKKTTGYFLEIK